MSLQGFKQQALAVSTDPEHRFELALQLGELKIAYQLAVEAEVCYSKLSYTIMIVPAPPSGVQIDQPTSRSMPEPTEQN